MCVFSVGAVYDLTNSCTIHPDSAMILLKGLETVSLAGSADTPEEIKRLLAEKNHLQTELQRCLQEINQKDLHFQQMNSKVTEATAVIPNSSCESELAPA